MNRSFRPLLFSLITALGVLTWNASAGDAATVATAPMQSPYLADILLGVWDADACYGCSFNVIQSGGYLYGELSDWGQNEYSQSNGYQQIQIVSDDTFFYMGDYFQVYSYDYTSYRIENVSGGGASNLSSASRSTFRSAPYPIYELPIYRSLHLPRYNRVFYLDRHDHRYRAPTYYRAETRGRVQTSPRRYEVPGSRAPSRQGPVMNPPSRQPSPSPRQPQSSRGGHSGSGSMQPRSKSSGGSSGSRRGPPSRGGRSSESGSPHGRRN